MPHLHPLIQLHPTCRMGPFVCVSRRGSRRGAAPPPMHPQPCGLLPSSLMTSSPSQPPWLAASRPAQGRAHALAAAVGAVCGGGRSGSRSSGCGSAAAAARGEEEVSEQQLRLRLSVHRGHLRHALYDMVDVPTGRSAEPQRVTITATSKCVRLRLRWGGEGARAGRPGRWAGRRVGGQAGVWAGRRAGMWAAFAFRAVLGAGPDAAARSDHGVALGCNTHTHTHTHACPPSHPSHTRPPSGLDLPRPASTCPPPPAAAIVCIAPAPRLSQQTKLVRKALVEQQARVFELRAQGVEGLQRALRRVQQGRDVCSMGRASYALKFMQAAAEAAAAAAAEAAAEAGRLFRSCVTCWWWWSASRAGRTLGSPVH
ncbi:hypothetical protein PLESTM_000066300 [Pleodorina starrii]|nr:hypothetical protein PLESTM_000066300 [Pleodorina starrii]